MKAQASRFPDVTIHESAYVDDEVEIGAGSKIGTSSTYFPAP